MQKFLLPNMVHSLLVVSDRCHYNKLTIITNHARFTEDSWFFPGQNGFQAIPVSSGLYDSSLRALLHLLTLVTLYLSYIIITTALRNVSAQQDLLSALSAPAP